MTPESSVVSRRSRALAERLEQGARALAAFASDLTDAEWQTRIPKDGRKIGVIVHHVATMYPLEIQLAQTLAGGQPVAGVTWDAVHGLNAQHARDHDVTGIERARRGNAQALVAVAMWPYRSEVAELAARSRLAVMGEESHEVQAGFRGLPTFVAPPFFHRKRACTARFCRRT